MNFTKEELPSFLQNWGSQMGTEVFEKYTCDEPDCSIVLTKSTQTGWIISVQAREPELDEETLAEVASSAIAQLIPAGVTMAQRGSSPFGTVFFQEDPDPQ